MDFARGVQTFRELFGSQIVPQAVEHVGVGISDTGLHHDAVGCVFPIADNAQGLFALQVFRPILVPIVDREHRNAALRIHEPSRQPEPVAVVFFIEKLLHQVPVLKFAVLVALDGIELVVLADLVEITIFEVVVRGDEAEAC